MHCLHSVNYSVALVMHSLDFDSVPCAAMDSYYSADLHVLSHCDSFDGDFWLNDLERKGNSFVCFLFF